MYCTVAYIVDRLTETKAIELTDDTGSGVVDTDMIEDNIIRASDRIDDSIRRKYILPLTNEHSTLKEICFNLTRFYLYDGRRTLSETVKEGHKIALEELKKIGLGSIVLDEDASSPQANFIQTNRARVEANKIFTDTLMDKYGV